MTKPPLDYELLDRELDKTKTMVFLDDKFGGFLAAVMSSVHFLWTEDIGTAQTNGLNFQWNPHWFLKLNKEARIFVLLHELWHIALLHMIRLNGRDPLVWNWAADVVINNMLVRAGYKPTGMHPWLDDCINKWKHPDAPKIGDYFEASVEEVYEALLPRKEEFTIGAGISIWIGPMPDDTSQEAQGGDLSDIVEPEEELGHEIVSAVVGAASGHKMAGGDLPGDVETTLKRFLSPKLPWNVLLQRFFNDLSGEDYSMARPNRRYQDMYLPSIQVTNDALDHIMHFQDVSGSVTDAEVVRMNSEVKFIKDTYNPRRLTVVLFDTIIQRVIEFTEDDPFDEIIIVGRGGTSLDCVRDYIIEHEPSVFIVFSDLQCTPMEPLPGGKEIPAIWVGVNASHSSVVPFGQLIHIRE